MDRRVPNAERKHRLNREIMVPQVRLNGVENEPLGIVPTHEALRMAGELDVDLVEIAATAEDGTLFQQSRAVFVPSP